jgi:hypothetical protein
MKTHPKGVLFLAFALCAAVLQWSCCPINPLLNTAITAHGNTDWHIDTAEEFLTGNGMDGNPTAPNHCPDTWTKRHMHVGLNSTAHYYYDQNKIVPGDDSDITNGIDRAMLFFYAGHGCPTFWNTLGDNAAQTNMMIGDCPGGGTLRYYWQCSCEVFAHGPSSCPGAGFDYACPGDFDGSADSYGMRNVYERWGPALHKYLRMAGGASTSAYCHEEQADRIWDDYNNNGYDVADSFIDGLNWWGVVPLCMTIGGADVTATPLYDAVFTNRANTSGTSHYHIQYVDGFDSTPTGEGLLVHIPDRLPILRMKPLPLPDPIRDLEYKFEGDWLYWRETVPGRGPKIRIFRPSGSIYFMDSRKASAVEKPLPEKEYISRAFAFIERQKWTEKYFAEPTGTKMMLESVPVNRGSKERRQAQKDVIVVFKRQIEVDSLRVNVLGNGGIMKVQMNNDGSILNATKTWRAVEGVKERVRIKTYDEAYAEALQAMENPKYYKLDRWNWGYKEFAGNVAQTELNVVFQFAFVPIEKKMMIDFPPRIVEVKGQK